MPIRITSNETKTGYVFAAHIVGVLLIFLAGAVGGTAAAAVTWAVLTLVAVVIAVRVFRGEGESVADPRAWWRMTARPTSGFVAALLFLAGGVFQFLAAAAFGTAFLLPMRYSPFLIVASVNVFVGVAFFLSSVRQSPSAATTRAQLERPDERAVDGDEVERP